MLKNYFNTAWRSLVRGKSFSVINISGLAIGMAGAVLILLWIQNEVGFDRFHKNKDNLYELYVLTANTDGHPSAVNYTSQPLGPALKHDFPEVESFSRVWYLNNWLIAYNNKSFTTTKGCFVDTAFLRMFTFPLVEGKPAEQFKNSSSIAITQSLAKKLFGNDEPIGKVIKIENTDNFTVTGVLKDPPANTRFDFDYLLPWSYHARVGDGFENDRQRWMSNNTHTFVLLKPNTDVKAFNAKIKDVAKHYTGRNDIWTHFVYPLSRLHLYSEFKDGKPVGGRIDTVRVFAIIAIFILLIACINFVNLCTAQSEKRAKEVGIRKVAGAAKALLVGQFIVEAFVTACIAGVLALAIVQMVLPWFNALIGTQLILSYSSIAFWLYAIAFILVTSLLAGSYPAFYLSSFKPVSIFKKQFKKSQSVLSPRKVLVVLQFTFAVILIISTLVIRQQVVYVQDRDKGYNNNNLVKVNFEGDIDKHYAQIKQELLSQGIATSVTKNMNGLVSGGAHTWGLRWANENPADTNTTITLFSSDEGLVATAGINLIAGRDIDINKYPADSSAVLLNETAVKLMGFKNPIGATIQQPFNNNASLHVIGVVKDFIAGSPYDAVPPTVIQGPGAWFTAMHIKLNPAHTSEENLAKAEAIFKKYNPAYPFDYQFVDAEYARNFENEQRTKTLAGLFAFLAIFISCLGLFGLSAYVAESRVKEIGVRKVLGASVVSITKLLSADFVMLVAVSVLIAVPVAWYAMDKWLQGYTFRISIGWGVFVLASLVALVIALATVSFQSVKAALANPVKSLRTE